MLKHKFSKQTEIKKNFENVFERFILLMGKNKYLKFYENFRLIFLKVYLNLKLLSNAINLCSKVSLYKIFPTIHNFSIN